MEMGQYYYNTIHGQILLEDKREALARFVIGPIDDTTIRSAICTDYCSVDSFKKNQLIYLFTLALSQGIIDQRKCGRIASRSYLCTTG